MPRREAEALSGPDFPDDATIQARVRDALAWEEDLRGTVIGVRVANSEVTLEGWVLTEQQRRLAGETADAVWGVGRVINNLSVRGERRRG
ncbi:MAG: BON domain-containing protein [Chloroflexota bacterium]